MARRSKKTKAESSPPVEAAAVAIEPLAAVEVAAPVVQTPLASVPARPKFALIFADWSVLASFLFLTFVLGMFHQLDTDIWWHLRTGDLIRSTGQIPRSDTYTFGAAGRRWIDLHWGFEVAASWVYERWGMIGLNLAKCVVTTLALFILIRARRRDWPIWVMALAWLPALVVLGGRMYIRPETLTLLFIAIFLAVLFRWREHPRLVFILPFTQLFWINTQGLFVFGPVLLAFGLIDAALRPGAFAAERRGWWKIALAGSALTGLACLVNPYHIYGALFPLELLQTMGDTAFSGIGELMSIPAFIQSRGWTSVPLWFHLGTIILCAISFLVPLLWRAPRSPEPPREARASRRKRRKRERSERPTLNERWTLSPFRLLLFGAFSLLSLKATRNSHQFAAIVGTVTAWNFGEWAAARFRARADNGKPVARLLSPRIATAGVLVIATILVGSGAYYRWADEGRTVGLDEKPLWFAHDAAKFAGQPGMPERFIAFHEGQAAVFEFHNAPERKVYVDPRLEVMGPRLYERYKLLGRDLSDARPGWREQLAALGNPGILVDNVNESGPPISATLMLSAQYRCVWYDPVASVFVPSTNPFAARPVDFAARHFDTSERLDRPALLATATTMRWWARSILMPAHQRPDRAIPLLLYGVGNAWRAARQDRSDFDAWKQLAILEFEREQTLGAPISGRFQKPFDQVLDLPAARTAYAMRQALERSGSDFATVLYAALAFEARGLIEEAVPLVEQLQSLTPVSPFQSVVQAELAKRLPALRKSLGAEPKGKQEWRNASELETTVHDLLARGRVASAVALLESARSPEGRDWEQADRIATLWLHLGRPERAREAWSAVNARADRCLQLARIALTYQVEGYWESARKNYEAALAATENPQPRRAFNNFEAHHGRATLERDAGDAAAAFKAASAAVACAPTDFARSAARSVVAQVEPYAKQAQDR